MRTLLLYIAAGAAYVTLGVFVTDAILSWFEGMAFILAAAVILPAIYRRLR